MNAFLRQDEAWAFVRSIVEPKQRLLTEIAVARALSFLAADPNYRADFAKAPMDLLTFARTAHAVFQNEEVLRGALDGSIKSIEDLDPFGQS